MKRKRKKLIRRKSNSLELSHNITYRIAESDKKLIIQEHGTISRFFNNIVESEVLKIRDPAYLDFKNAFKFPKAL